jgi:hypothetical protein
VIVMAVSAAAGVAVARTRHPRRPSGESHEPSNAVTPTDAVTPAGSSEAAASAQNLVGNFAVEYATVWSPPAPRIAEGGVPLTGRSPFLDWARKQADALDARLWIADNIRRG